MPAERRPLGWGGQAYSGTAGQVATGQIGVFLAYAGRLGQTVLARALSLPASWTQDPQRRRKAGVPPEVGFATKPALAQVMLARAFAAWVPAAGVYGAARGLRVWLEGREKAHVLAVSGKDHVGLGGRVRTRGRRPDRRSVAGAGGGARPHTGKAVREGLDAEA